jgi:glycerol kinase
MSYILAIDQGTSSTKTIIFNEEGKALFKASEPLTTHYLQGNHVEQDPEEIYRNVLLSVEKCINGFKTAGGEINKIKACGISNQRETFVLWDKQGKPLYNAVVWQCKRSVRICDRLKDEGIEKLVRDRTGLIIDPYFSGTKVIWIYENNEKVQRAVDAGEAYFGTVDTWLLYKLTKGGSYMTDYTNASRTMFFNLAENNWDHHLLERFGLVSLNLPEPKPSSFPFGATDFDGIVEGPIEICGMIGDSHAAAFGEGLYTPGTAKATLGTGCSVLMNVGGSIKPSGHGMVSTICWSTKEQTDYALEGIIVTCGATLEWLKNKLGLFAENKEIEGLNNAVDDNNGVYLVPAFSGLGAPHWDMNRKASLVGLTFDCNKSHIVRAALESIPYQIKDVISAMEKDSGIQLKELQVDGGITSDRFVLQFLADLLNRPVVNIGIADVSALGAAYMAGLGSGIFKDLQQLKWLQHDKVVYTPGENREKVNRYYAGWQDALNRVT